MAKRFTFNFGTMDEVISGRGQEVESFEDIYSTREGFIVPKIIGASQDSRSINAERLGLPAEPASPGLIAVIYSPGDFPISRVLKDYVDERNLLKRIVCLPYTQAGSPSYFSKKPSFPAEKLARLTQECANTAAGQRSFAGIAWELEKYSLAEQNFGLTLVEAANKRILIAHFGLLKGLPGAEKFTRASQ